jgi:hypothetical protein
VADPGSVRCGGVAAAYLLKAMVAEAGASISGIATEGELARTSFGKPAWERLSAEDGRRAILRSILPPVILAARRRISNVVDMTAANRVIPECWEGFSRAADSVIAASDGPWPWLRAAIRGADLVVIHGDGVMVGEGIIPRTDLFLAYLAHERLDTPGVLVNHSADFDRPELRRMAEHVYPLLAGGRHGYPLVQCDETNRPCQVGRTTWCRGGPRFGCGVSATVRLRPSGCTSGHTRATVCWAAPTRKTIHGIVRRRQPGRSADAAC